MHGLQRSSSVLDGAKIKVVDGIVVVLYQASCSSLRIGLDHALHRSNREQARHKRKLQTKLPAYQDRLSYHVWPRRVHCASYFARPALHSCVGDSIPCKRVLRFEVSEESNQSARGRITIIYKALACLDKMLLTEWDLTVGKCSACVFSLVQGMLCGYKLVYVNRSFSFCDCVVHCIF